MEQKENMNIVPKSFNIDSNPEIKQIISILRDSGDTGLLPADASVFLEFPLYKDDKDEVIMTQLLVVSPNHGVIIIHSSNISRADPATFKKEESKLDKVAGHITSKLFKNDKLRSGLMGLAVPIYSVFYARNIEESFSVDSLHTLIKSKEKFISFINEVRSNVKRDLIDEVISSIQGAKGLLRPTERNIENYNKESKVFKVDKVESKILKFDSDQQDGYIPAINAPHRIRGLAGSGKTVVLTMKVVQTLLRERDRNISVLYSFSTKSLYQHVKRLIHRFFREFHDDMSYLDCVKVLHAWGGTVNAGVYYNACISHNVIPLTYQTARNEASIGEDPFEYACNKLLQTVEIKPMYDYVFVDEAQDFSKSYLLLCTKLAKNNRVTLGADVFQNIFQKKVPNAREIFGENSALTFQQDDFLETCYRTPLAVLVSAHAIGLGVYGEKQVQKIESVELWQSLGYEVLSRNNGNFLPNEKIIVRRNQDKSPTLIEEPVDSLIKTKCKFSSMDEEVEFVASEIINDITVEGLLPEDILVICMDDKICTRYFNALTMKLLQTNILTNNIHSDKYSITEFYVKGRVTLSTVHKAKGNEAYTVYMMGCDYVSHNLNTRNRNLIFTGMTRTKGWLYLTGFGSYPESLFLEIEKAKRICPEIKFNYPSADAAERIDADLKRKSPVNEAILMKLKAEMDALGGAEEFERLLQELEARKDKK